MPELYPPGSTPRSRSRRNLVLSITLDNALVTDRQQVWQEEEILRPAHRQLHIPARVLRMGSAHCSGQRAYRRRKRGRHLRQGEERVDGVHARVQKAREKGRRPAAQGEAAERGAGLERRVEEEVRISR